MTTPNDHKYDEQLFLFADTVTKGRITAGDWTLEVGCLTFPNGDRLITQEWLTDRDKAADDRATAAETAILSVTCPICNELTTPDDDAVHDGARWLHYDCAEAGE